MLEIEYKGANTVIITTKNTVIVTDPKLSIVGLDDVIVKDSVELLTEQRLKVNHHDFKVLIDGPGEYGVGDCDIVGIASRRYLDDEKKAKSSTFYKITTGEIKIAVIGNIDFNLSDDQLEQLGIVDILIIPVGGNGYTLDFLNATKLVNRIEPKVVIPVHYFDKKIDYHVNQDSVDNFIESVGLVPNKQDRFKLKNSGELPSNPSLVVLNRN